MNQCHVAAAAAAALLVLAGCGGAETAGADRNLAAAPTGNSAAAAVGAGDPHGEEEQDSPSLLLAADGVMPGGSEESMIRFGANSLDTIEKVTPLLGGTYDKDRSEECGAGPMEFAHWGKVVLMFQAGEFVGWELREASEEPFIGTPGGATIGTSRSELQAALGAAVQVEQSSLGAEFNAGGISGLLSADAPDAKVTALWAGTNCIMR